MNNITVSDRIFRLALSLGLIAVVVSSTGPLGSLVYLPFISIYTGITAFIGWDPIAALVTNVDKGVSDKQAHAQHVELMAH